MRKTKMEKGITLVALIITIIVLLILAVVAIRAVQGDGILQYAQNSANEYEKAQGIEDTVLDSYLVKLEENDPSVEKIPTGEIIGDASNNTIKIGDLVYVATDEKHASVYGFRENETVYNSTNNMLKMYSPNITSTEINILEKVKINGKVYTVNTIADCAFGAAMGGASNTNKIIIPNSITKIGVAAFWFCNKLTDITIPTRCREYRKIGI